MEKLTHDANDIQDVDEPENKMATGQESQNIENEDINVIRRSARQRRPNVRYADHVHSEVDDDTNNNTAADEPWPFEDIGASVLEYIMTQHTLRKAQRYLGNRVKMQQQKN